MKTREAIDLYMAYTSLRFAGVPTADRILMFRNMRRLRPVAEEYEALRMNAAERCKPDGLDALEQEITSLAGKAVTPEISKKLARYNLQKAEYTKALNEYLLGTFSKETGTRTGGLLDEEHDLEMECISAEAYEKLVEANEQADTKHLCIISQYVKE